MVPKWCPDVKNKVVKRKTATITRYKKSLCLQGFSQITYKKICGNTGRFWLFHDPRNQVVLTGSWVRIPPLPPNKNANFDTKLAFLLFAQKALFHCLFQTFTVFHSCMKPSRERSVATFFVFESKIG